MLIEATIFSAIKSAKEAKKMKALLARSQAENETWYKANALGDYTQRADAQNLLRVQREELKAQGQAQENMAVMGGTTPEAIAAQKERSSKSMSDTYATLGAMGQQFKDKITDQYLQRKDALNNQEFGMYEQSKANYDTLFNNSVSQIGNVASKMAGMGMGG